MKSRGGLSAVALVALMAGAAPASATTEYDFFYDSMRVATLTTNGNTEFSFAFLSAPNLTGAFINDILLDMGPGDFTGKFQNTTAGSVTTPTYSYKAGGFEGTGIESKVSFSTSNNAKRLTLGETATWNINGVFDGPARLHVNAFIGGQSVKLTTAVPEPESYAMALAALGVLGVYRRRSRSKT